MAMHMDGCFLCMKRADLGHEHFQALQGHRQQGTAPDMAMYLGASALCMKRADLSHKHIQALQGHRQQGVA